MGNGAEKHVTRRGNRLMTEGVRRVEYEDLEGKKFWSTLPVDAPLKNARYGVLEGPPELTALNLPDEVRVRLHNALFKRNIFTTAQAKVSRLELISAMQEALELNPMMIVEAYQMSEGS
jgi:hypothetical protein